MSSVAGISAAPAGAAVGRALGGGDFRGQSSERHSRALRAALPWAGLLTVVLLFLGYLAWLHPERFFGRYHDDTVYFSSAQALAQGRGYILPSLPGPGGAPTRQTKYPILFPWLLSWIWRWKPSFPGNIGAAVWMTAAFACWFLIASFLQVRKMRGFGGWSALAIVGLCAFHPHFLFLSGALLSDVPFMALALTAALVADTAMRPRGSAGLAAIAALLAALSLLTRGFGLAVLAGIIAAALFRRAWRQCAVFCLVAAPFAVLGAFGQRAHPELLVPLGSDPGWRQTWLFYTIYGGFWRLGVPHLNVLAAMIGQNLCELLLAPASFCLFPPLGGESFGGGLLNFSLSAGIFTGIVKAG